MLEFTLKKTGEWSFYNAHGCWHNGCENSCKVCTNRLNPFIVIKEQKKRRKKKKTFTTFPHTLASRYQRDTTYGIRAKRLKRSDLMDLSTYRYDVSYVNYNMWYYNAFYERKYCWNLCSDGLSIVCNACTKI